MGDPGSRSASPSPAGRGAVSARKGRGGVRFEDPDVIRVGFTASRKVGSAVQRNRARRRLRAAVAEVLPDMGQTSHDYVVIARAATPGRPYAALLGDLRTALARLGEAPRKKRPRKPAREAAQ